MTQQQTARDERVRELYRMPKARLTELFYQRCPGFLWSRTPPRQWSRDELVSEILRVEFPREWWTA